MDAYELGLEAIAPPRNRGWDGGESSLAAKATMSDDPLTAEMRPLHAKQRVCAIGRKGGIGRVPTLVVATFVVALRNVAAAVAARSWRVAASMCPGRVRGRRAVRGGDTWCAQGIVVGRRLAHRGRQLAPRH